MKIVKLELENYKSFNNLTMDENELSDFLVFAGRNGTGKTALMEAIADCLKPSSSGNNGVIQSNQSCVGPDSDVGIAYLKVRLDSEEVEFITKKYTDLMQSGQIHVSPNEPSKYDETVPTEFESKVIYYHNQSSIGSQPSNTKSLLGNYKAISQGVLGLVHPLEIFVQRNVCQSVIFFNAYRQVDISDTQIFAGMPIAPGANPQSFATQHNAMNSGNQGEHRQTMTFPLLRALNDITMYEAFEELNQPAFQSKLKDKLKTQLDLMNKLLKPKQVLTPRFIKERNVIEYVIKTPTSEHPITTLSAGENELLILSSYLFRTIDYRQLNGISPIILIDEPELHLHATYVGRLANFIKDLAFNKSNCFIASHSPDFIDAFDDSLRTIEDGQIKKIIGLEQRKQLFADIGRKITPSALVEKIVFVEGDTGTTKKLHDEYIYQHLLDPEAIKTLFVSVGDRIQARLAGHVTDKFIEAIRKSSTDNNIFMLNDGDDSIFNYVTPSSYGNVRILDIYHLENLLLDIDAFVAATALYGTQKTRDETILILKTVLNGLIQPFIAHLKHAMMRREQLKILDQLHEPAIASVNQKKTDLEAIELVIEKDLNEYKAKLEASIESQEWRRLFKGSEVIDGFNKALNQASNESVGFKELQEKLLSMITFDDLLPETQRILESFKLTT